MPTSGQLSLGGYRLFQHDPLTGRKYNWDDIELQGNGSLEYIIQGWILRSLNNHFVEYTLEIMFVDAMPWNEALASIPSVSWNIF